MDSRYVTIASYQLPAEARIAASILEDRDIPTVVLDDNSSMLSGGLVQVRLQVPVDRAGEAVEILEAVMTEDSDLLEDVEDAYARNEAEQSQSHWKDLPEGTRPVVCLRCLSLNSHKTLPSPVPAWLNVLGLGLPRLIFPAKLQCRGCGAVFQ